LDLDETLVHGEKEGEVKITVPLSNGMSTQMAVNLRPGLKPFLRSMSKIYEVIVFTSSDRAYANAVLDMIDPDHTLIHHRLYREHCTLYSENFYIKDLRILNRDLKNVIIVDNAPYAFGYQLDNGYPIIAFIDNKDDKELNILSDYLQHIANVDDMREMNKKKFNLQWLCTISAEEFLKYYIPNNDVIRTELKQTLSSYFAL